MPLNNRFHDNAVPSIRPLRRAVGALSLLFVDISLQRSAEAEKCKQTLKNTGGAMTMAAVMESRAETQAWPQTSRIVRVELVRDITEAETAWRGLEQPNQLST